jgi:hypothetical protein
MSLGLIWCMMQNRYPAKNREKGSGIEGRTGRFCCALHVRDTLACLTTSIYRNSQMAEQRRGARGMPRIRNRHAFSSAGRRRSSSRVLSFGTEQPGVRMNLLPAAALAARHCASSSLVGSVR